MKDILNKLKSVKLCMQAHPDNVLGSEFDDRISDLSYVINELEKPLDFKQSAMPLIKYICENHDPHTKAIIDSSRIELVQGIKGEGEIYDYLKD